MDWVDKLIGWVIGIFCGGLLILLGWCIVQMMQGPWYGEGTVAGKEYHASYVTLINCGKSALCPITQPECNWLKVVEKNGDVHEGCVSQRVWEDAMLGHHIRLTKEYS